MYVILSGLLYEHAQSVNDKSSDWISLFAQSVPRSLYPYLNTATIQLVNSFLEVNVRVVPFTIGSNASPSTPSAHAQTMIVLPSIAWDKVIVYVLSATGRGLSYEAACSTKTNSSDW